MADPLLDHLRSCCVQVDGESSGCGFFITPNLVVTCAHVVGLGRQKGDPINLFQWAKDEVQQLPPATLVKIFPDEGIDIALLSTEDDNAAFAPLDGDVQLGDQLVAVGFPRRGNRKEFTQSKVDYEGPTQFQDPAGRIRVEIKFTFGQVEPGFSGGPLLNWQTGHVMGVVNATRDRNTNLGGWAIGIDVLSKILQDSGVQLPAVDQKWTNAVRKQKDKNSGDDPKLLPYMVNRSAQEEEVSRRLQNTDPTSPKPFVIIVYGDEYQCHDKFIERLQIHTLPKLLRLKKTETVSPYFLPWPNRAPDVNAIKRELVSKLAEKTEGDASASQRQIQQSLANNPYPVMVYTQLETADWRDHGIQCLKGFLQCWQDWPELVQRQRLIVCWLMQYQVMKSGTSKSGILGLFRRRNTDTSQQIIEALEVFSGAEYSRIDCVVLPKLEAVDPRDVRDWAIDFKSEISVFYNGPDFSSEVAEIIRQWENEGESSSIPMEELGKRLFTILSPPLTLREAR